MNTVQRGEGREHRDCMECRNIPEALGMQKNQEVLPGNTHPYSKQPSGKQVQCCLRSKAPCRAFTHSTMAIQSVMGQACSRRGELLCEQGLLGFTK